MKLSGKQYSILFLALLSFILFIVIFKWTDYLVKNDYIYSTIYENFTPNLEPIRDVGSPQTTHSVDLPLTTTYSCKNFCGPTSRCSITGQQCLSDIDCPGCQPYVPPLPPSKIDCVRGDNDAGKLTVGVTPTYSPLTYGYGTRERIITDDLYGKPAQPNFGVNTWINAFNESEELFNKRYKPQDLQYMPKYPPMYSITGDFLGDGPLPSNY